MCYGSVAGRKVFVSPASWILTSRGSCKRKAEEYAKEQQSMKTNRGKVWDREAGGPTNANPKDFAVRIGMSAHVSPSHVHISVSR